MAFLDEFYSGIGNKIKVLAKALFIIFTVALLISGLIGICSSAKGLSSINSNNNTIDQSNEDGTWYHSSEVTEKTKNIMREIYIRQLITSMVIFFIGPIVSWIGTWCLYGFGELIEKTSQCSDFMLRINQEVIFYGEKNFRKEETAQKVSSEVKQNEEETRDLYGANFENLNENNKLAFLYANDKITKEEYERGSNK